MTSGKLGREKMTAGVTVARRGRALAGLTNDRACVAVSVATEAMSTEK